MIDANKLIFPPGSKVVLKRATLFHEQALVVYKYEIRLLKNIYKQVISTYNGKEITTKLISQFFIQTDEVMIGSNISYGKGSKPAKVIGLDKERDYSTDKTYATIEFLSGDRKTVLYNSCNLKEPTLTPLGFDLYRELWTDYKLRDRMPDKSKLFYLMAHYYKLKTIDGIMYATDPQFLEDNEPELKTMEEIEKQIAEDEKAVSEVYDPPLTNAKIVYVENKKINLDFNIEELKKQLLTQGYKITKL